MRQILFVVTAFVATGALVAMADDPPPIPLPATPPKTGQPRLGADRIMQLEEDVEVLEANRDVKRACIKAATVSVTASKTRYEATMKAAGGIGSVELITAKYEHDMANAQLEIRLAELKEVEVKLKYAKKRLEDAKKTGLRPATDTEERIGSNEQESQPALPRGRIPTEQEIRIADLQWALVTNAANIRTAIAVVSIAEEDVKQFRERAKRGGVSTATVDAAETIAAKAREIVTKLNKDRQKMKAEIAELGEKLRKAEK